MLHNKFLEGVTDNSMYHTIMSQLNMGATQQKGKHREYDLDEYAVHLQRFYLEKREKSMAQGRAKGFAAKVGDSDNEDETGFALQETSKEQGVCFSMRDTGKCKYGDKCKYSHKVKVVHKAHLSVSDKNKILLQEIETERLLSAQAANSLQEQKKKYQQRVKFYKSKSNLHKKKMENYKLKLGKKNKNSADRANLAEDNSEQKETEEDKEESDVEDPSGSDEVSDLDKSE
jgi:hypothetical protein